MVNGVEPWEAVAKEGGAVRAVAARAAVGWAVARAVEAKVEVAKEVATVVEGTVVAARVEVEPVGAEKVEVATEAVETGWRRRWRR